MTIFRRLLSAISLLALSSLRTVRAFSHLSNFKLAGMKVPADKPMATIAKVKSIQPIVGADQVESVQVLGWNCVAKKGEFSPGQLCVYFMIGSIFPDNYPRVTFLDNKPLKTKKIRGCISQGLLGQMEWLQDFNVDASGLAEGADVTNHFGIMKYVATEESDAYTMQQSPFPPHIPRTDEERIQNIPDVLEELRAAEAEVVITRKEDGCSATYVLDHGAFLVCGRNYVMPQGTVYHVPVDKHNLRQVMTDFGRNLAIQGEIVGPKVNGNRLQLNEHFFKVFNIFDIDESVFLPHEEIVDICRAMGLETVPLLYKGPAKDAIMLNDVCSLLAFADTVTYDKAQPAEGVVVKVNERTPNRKSFKAISNKFLLKIGQ